MTFQRYRYVGPPEIRERALKHIERTQLCEAGDLIRWITRAEPIPKRRSYVPVTFVVDLKEQLWIADRRSEHVACAAGEDVLAAGELVLAQFNKAVEIIEATNQSTGYCPEPQCWAVVAMVLDRLHIQHPPSLPAAFEFRRCGKCAATNLIKDGVFECSVCGMPLDESWNYS